jgi:class 3 adenylate cyclase
VPEEVTKNVTERIGEIAAVAQSDLKTPAEIEVVRAIPADISKIPIEATQDGKKKWLKLEEASVVATDLKSSTAFSYSKRDGVGARLYQASTGGASQVVQTFFPGYVAIQGDGLFAVFTGGDHSERAMCAAISLNAFGWRLATMLKDEFGEEVPEMKSSGLKIGADSGTLLVRRIGVRGDHNEPVWAGKPVNYASKCAAEADAGQVIVTNRFFKPFRGNQYIQYSCGHPDSEKKDVVPLWQKLEVAALGERDKECRLLLSSWCTKCGASFCEAVLAGERDRGLNTGQMPKWREEPETAAAA